MNIEKEVLRVALYIRVSSQEQADEGYSIAEQESRLRDYCKAMRWTIHKIYIDPAYSGGNTDRPALQDMIRDVEAGEIDKVVVYKLDRLSRSQLDTLYLIERVFLANNTDFVSMLENFDTSTSFGRAMIGILAVFAQLEREQIKERTQMGKEARAKEGKWNGGSSEPIGYNYNSTTGDLKINDYEKMQILEAVDLFLKGTPLRTICRIFEDKGYTYRGRSGKVSKWEPKRLKYVFRSKLYLGFMSYKGEWYPAEHTPIYTQEMYDKLQRLLDQRAEMYAKHKKKCQSYGTHLGGLLVCKKCGAKYHKQIWQNRQKVTTDMYTCYSRSKKMKAMIKDPSCKNKHWKVKELDALVFDEIRNLVLDPDYINKVREIRSNDNEKIDKVKVLEKEIKSIEEQISRFMDLYGIGKFTIDQVSSKIDPLNEQRVALEKELEAITATDGELSVEETLRIAKSFDEVLERGDLDEIRLVLETLIYYIEVDDEDIYIHWKFE